MARHLFIAVALASVLGCGLSVPACEIDPLPELEVTAPATEAAPVTKPAPAVYPVYTRTPSPSPNTTKENPVSSAAPATNQASATEPAPVTKYPAIYPVNTRRPSTDVPVSTATSDVEFSTPATSSEVPTTAKASTASPSLSVSPSNPDDTTPRKSEWKDHPLYRANPDSVVLPILAWFTTRSSEDYEWSLASVGRYTRQASRYNLLADGVRDTPEAKEYHNYDLLHLGTYGAEGIDNWLDFELTRSAKVCVVMGVDDDSANMDRDSVMTGPPGFKSIGMVQWDEESEKPENHKYARYTSTPISWGYLACKTMAAGTHKLPSVDSFGAQYKLWGYNLIFSEVDGSIPPLAPMPAGWTGPDILEHTSCPSELHDMWSVGVHDPNDPDIAGKRFTSWHPQLDLVYGCYYMHEHGSFPGLAGYTARYDYTAWKNDRQDESDVGFKTYVVPAGKYYVVYTLHSDTSDFERISKEFHTVVLAVTEKSTGKLMFEMSGKASSGGAGARYESKFRPKEGVQMVPLGTAENKKRMIDMYSPERYRDREVCFKRINLYNPPNLRPDLDYEGDTEAEHSRGIYEAWTMRMLSEFCMNTTEPFRAAGPKVDIKNSHNGCRDEDCRQKIVLGRSPNQYRDYFTPNMGNNREVVFRATSIGPQYCKHPLPEPNAEGYHVFYTDQYANELCDGPGVNCIMQRIHSSFEGVSLNDRYETTDVHGHNMYEPASPLGIDDFDNRKRGLNGIANIAGNLAVSVEEP